MIITCEACNTSFNLDDKMLKPTGSKVRCSVCAKVFTAFPQQASTPEPVTEKVASETEATSESDVAAAAGMAFVAQDGQAAADTVDVQPSETDAIEDEADLDVALEDEPEEGVSDVEIEDAVSDLLDEGQTDIPTEVESDDESSETIVASLDDDDFSLDPSPEPIEEDGTATVIVNLDDDLDLSFDEGSDITEATIDDLDQEDFDLDPLPATDGDPEGNETVIVNLEDDFNIEPEALAESVSHTDDATAETVDDLGELDFTLEPDEQAAPSAPALPEADDMALDEVSASAADSGAGVDDDLDLTLDMDDVDAGEMESVAEVSELEDDLDLSSLESLLMDDENGEDDSAAMVVDDGEEPELGLDMGAETALDDSDAAGMPEEALEDLEFDLDADGGNEAADIEVAEGDDGEIDLSEIEKMLEEPETESVDVNAVPEQDLDLDIEASLETEKWMSESGGKGTLIQDEELDLSELEQVLDDVDTEEGDEPLEEPELDLDLGDDEMLGTPTETVAIDNELDFDLSDFEEDAPSKAGGEDESRESADMALEFEVETDSQTEQTLEDEGLEETVAIPDQHVEETKKAPPVPIDTASPISRPKPVKKGMSKAMVFLLIIVILAGGGYGTFYLLNQNGIDIPFLSNYLKPKVNDPGNLKLTTYDINSKFIDNVSAGKLFVVSGKVKNGYAENRGMITLQGKLFSTGKVPVNQERVYCGNIMSDLELANLEWEKIKARLANRLGDNRSNVKIEPGMSIPFMVVFSGLPDDLEEFTIEVTGSTTLK